MAERDPDLPETIDRYECLRKIATGGMAEIFLAKQSGLEGFEKVVVLKRILRNLAMDEEFVRMFLDEARIAAKLSHPNIVQIYDLGKADDSYYIAMEYVSGRNVQEIIEKETSRGALIPVEHVCRIIAGICDGLYYAHTRKDYDGEMLNIVHRDISPQNILVSFAGGVKVVDFGIAKASTQLAQTRAGVLKGKYAYMSPEQVKGNSIDARADIFAVGLVMYEMLTGRRAFERESSLKTLKAIVQEKPLNPREVNPRIPMEVVKLLSKALEKSPDRRYNDAQEMQLALEDYLDSSARKSNNIRISRYLYEIFDDELNSKSGTMVVEGVGEVIVPTAARKGPLEPISEEEVDSKTMAAALVPHTHNVEPDSLYDESEEESEEEDRTIPVFDLDKYEQERAAQHAKQKNRHKTHDDSEDPTQAGVSLADLPPPKDLLRSVSLEEDPIAYHDDDKTRTLDEIAAALPSAPKQNIKPLAQPRSQTWEADTNDIGSADAKFSAEVSKENRPAATVEPAMDAAVNLEPHSEIALGITPPTLAPTGPPVAEQADEIPAKTIEAPNFIADSIEEDEEKGGIPLAALLVVVVLFGMFFLFIAASGVLYFVFSDDEIQAQTEAQITVQVDSTPQHALVRVDGEEKGKTPIIFRMPQGAQHKIELSLDGFTPVKTELDLSSENSYVLFKKTLKKN